MNSIGRYNPTVNITSSLDQTTYLSQMVQNYSNQTVYNIKGEWHLQEKTPAYILGERVVRPLLDWAPRILGKAVETLKRSFLAVDHAFTRAVTFPCAEAQKLPPNALEKIREVVEALNDGQLTGETINQIITDKTGKGLDEIVPGLDSETAQKILDCFNQVVSIAGVAVNPSEFTNFMLGELEEQITAKIDNLGKKREAYEMQFVKPKSQEQIEKESKQNQYKNKMSLNTDLARKKLELIDENVNQFNSIDAEIKQIEIDIQAKIATGKGILAEAQGKGNTYTNIAVSYVSLEEKIDVGEKLQKSLNDGIGRAQYVLNRYGEIFEDGLTNQNVNKLPQEDQEKIAYAKRRLSQQEEMLMTVNSKLIVDQRSLNGLISGGQAASDSVQRLHKYLEEVVADYKSLESRKETLLKEQAELAKQSSTTIDEVTKLLTENESLQKLHDEL